ncbi:MAG: hypothetical protein KF788_08710 [Piscinibacter sp.]|nr:hypothetical protein [Piscinibacter sp.]
MPNIHTPERGPAETQDEYRARRRRSQRALRLLNPRGGKLTSRQLLRDEQRRNGTLRAGAYGKGLRNWITVQHARRGRK